MQQLGTNVGSFLLRSGTRLLVMLGLCLQLPSYSGHLLLPES